MNELNIDYGGVLTASLDELLFLVLNGPPGVSPTITIEDIEGGHRVTIVDVNGSHSFDIMDGASSEQIAAAIASYFEEHPIVETDPTVPSWAKQPTKPTYMASEVGALPADTPIPQDKVFVAVRGTTTETQIREAHNAGKVVMCVYQNRVYYLADTEGKMTFRTEPDALGAVYALFVSGSTWGGMSYNFALDSDIPVVPQMATQTDMSDWTSGKTVDAAVLKTDASAFVLAVNNLNVNKADKTEIPTKTSDLTNDSGFQTAPFEIPITQSGSAYTTTASAADILAHADNCVLVQSGGSAMCPISYFAQGSNAQIVFSGTDSINGFIQNVTFTVTVNNGTVTIGYYRAEDALPTVTASDNGKSLVVVNGAWTASSALQTKSITDTGNYYTTDTVEGALQEIGAELAGVNTLIGSGVIT